MFIAIVFGEYIISFSGYTKFNCLFIVEYLICSSFSFMNNAGMSIYIQITLYYLFLFCVMFAFYIWT